MRKIFKLLIILFVMCSVLTEVRAQDYRVLVLPDNIQFESTNYYIYPDASILFASEIIDALNHSGKVKTVCMAEVRDALRSNLKLNLLAKNTLKEFKYNYNISFVDFRNIARKFSVDKVLIITSTTDAQNYILRRTAWDLLNVPGTTVVDPAYKISTFVALVDVEQEKILWQQTYRKSFSSMENRMLANTFAPASEQLDKLKLYSSVLSPVIAKHVEDGVIPKLSVEAEVIPVPAVVEDNEVPVNNIQTPVNIEPMPFVQSKPRSKNNNFTINDL